MQCPFGAKLYRKTDTDRHTNIDHTDIHTDIQIDGQETDRRHLRLLLIIYFVRFLEVFCGNLGSHLKFFCGNNHCKVSWLFLK